MRLKLFLSFLLIVLVSVSLVAVIARRGAVNEVRQFMFHGGVNGLNNVSAGLGNYYKNNGSWNGVQSIFTSPRSGVLGMSGMMGQQILLVDQSGTVLADTQSSHIGQKLDAIDLSNSVPIDVAGKTVGYLFSPNVVTSAPLNEQQVLNRLNRSVLLAGIISAVLGLVISLLLAYTLLRPVRALTIAAQKLAQGDLSQCVDIRGADELATLGHTFNQMADSLQQAEQSRRAMTADIAHELRTPLAVQRANLEALQDGVYPLTVENLVPVIEQNHLLTHLVDDLRTLALVDAGQIELECIPSDLVSLVQRLVERFQPQAATQQVSLQVNPPSAPLPAVLLDPVRLEQILTNLLSNALRYTPSGGTIALDIEQVSGNVLVRVHDSGPGIPAEELPYIFDRFYRVDKSRARLEGGSGLGLAIARQLARAHGGELTATNHPAGGALFTLSLPIK